MLSSQKVVVPLSELSGQTVSFVTDVEGNLDYWNRWIDISQSVYRQGSKELELRDNHWLVYGGDIWDRGPGDLRVVSELVGLKKKYPYRVHIVLGNRDINKIRLLTELSEDALKQDLITYWTGCISSKNVDSTNSISGDRLKLILEKTMGCPHTFKYRLQELRELGSILSTDSSSMQAEKVVSSYIEALKPGGIMAEYLRLGSIAVLLGDCLFVHGGFHRQSMGWLPPRYSPNTPASTASSWVLGLKEFHDKEVEDLYRGKSRMHESKLDLLYRNQKKLAVPFSLTSKVTHGFQRGSKELGYPTANLDTSAIDISSFFHEKQRDDYNSKLLLCLDNIDKGVYVGCARLRDEDSCDEHTIEHDYSSYRPCVFSVGNNPTFDSSKQSIEVHLIDIDLINGTPSATKLSKIFYGKLIEVHAFVYLREMHKFDSTDDLKECIRKDVDVAKSYCSLVADFLSARQLQGRGDQNASSSWSTRGGYLSPHPGSGLVQYGMGSLPGKVRNLTVIYDNFLNDGSPEPPDEAVLSFLMKSGVKRVVTGHQPHGDSPLIISSKIKDMRWEGSNVLFVACDTSYSNDVVWDLDFFASSHQAFEQLVSGPSSPSTAVHHAGKDDTRGIAVAEVNIQFETTSAPSRIAINGILSNAFPYDFEVEGSIGKRFQVDDSMEWWVKGRIRCINGSNVYLVSSSKDRTVTNSFVSEAELYSLLPTTNHGAMQ